MKSFTPAELDAILVRRDRYPRSARYPSSWVWENQMGSQCLWLTESLTWVMDFRPGMRVLDLGCGKALSSIFLAKEFGCQVWAVDLRVPPTENRERIEEAGVAGLVFPLRGDARDLPFADGFFDAVVSINTYWIFGTDDFYLRHHFARLLPAGGVFGLIVPGLLREYADGGGAGDQAESRTEAPGPGSRLPDALPDHVKPFWLDHVIAYHSPAWWRRHLERSGLVELSVADNLDDGEGVRVWQVWAQLLDDTLIAKDDGRNIGFVRLVGRKK